jgi:hypothetical protein
MMRSRLLCTTVSIALLGLAGSASSAEAQPAWSIRTAAVTHAKPNSTFDFLIAPKNVGDVDADGTETVEIDLPADLTGVSYDGNSYGSFDLWSCSDPFGAHTVTCSPKFPINTAGNEAPFLLTVAVGAGASGVSKTSFEVTGGGAIATASTTDLVDIVPSLPGFGIDAFDGALTAPGGQNFTQAGGAPAAFSTTVDFNTVIHPHFGQPWPAEPVKDVDVDLPAGFLGNPRGPATCTMNQLVPAGEGAEAPLCPSASQVGVADVSFGPANDFLAHFPGVPVFNVTPAPGSSARFGFQVLAVVVVFEADLRPGDSGISVHFPNISEGMPMTQTRLTFWGIPGDHSHDAERACPGKIRPAAGGPSTSNPGQFGQPACGGNFSQVPFLRLPTSCTPAGHGLPFSLRADSWFHIGDFKQASFETHGPPDATTEPDPALWGDPEGTTECDSVPVKGSLQARTTALDTDTPSGLQVKVSVPNLGLENPGAISTSDVKAVKVTLPDGVTVNPSQAEGLGVCTPAQYASTELSFEPDPSKGCPSDSKIGTVEVRTPLLEETIPGDVYIAAPHDNPFDSLLALYVVMQEPQRGVQIKLAAKVETDKRTGQITTTFNDLPQLPFSSFDFKFREGARAPLVTPPACGTYITEAEFTPWSDPSHKITSKSSFQITRGIGGGPCPSGGLPPFKPGLVAGSINNNAGSYSPFNLRLFRNDGEQEITNFSIKLPPGVTGKLAGVPFCSDAAIAAAKDRTGAEEIASPSCPKASEVGRTLVGAGVGSVLAYAPGKIYLAGSYHGSPLSIAAITAAKVGPFDLGTVVVREALRINPETAEVFIDATGSDPIPHIIDGVTVHLRDIRAYVDKPDFTLNPTDCDATSTASTVLGSGLDFASLTDDQPVTVTTRYQAANCARLGFKPKLALRLIGPTHRSAHPKLRATLRARRGDANIGRAAVTLPATEYLESAHIQTICTRVQYAADACPAKSVYGYAKAWTPLLDKPLEGPVYLRSSSHRLPDLVASLDGEIHIDLDGRIDSVGSGTSRRIRNVFEAVPDAPVSKFILTMQGGRKGLLVNNSELCRAKPRMSVKFTGQNGKVSESNPLVKADCGKGGKKSKSRRPDSAG